MATTAIFGVHDLVDLNSCHSVYTVLADNFNMSILIQLTVQSLCIFYFEVIKPLPGLSASEGVICDQSIITGYIVWSVCVL